MTKERDDEDLKEEISKFEEQKPKKKKRGCIKALIIFLIILGIAAAVFYFMFFSPFAFPGTGLKGESKGQINILVLGRGGEGHSGANLTDTIMLVMIRNKDDKVGMLSIPRDLWIPDGDYGNNKINALFSAAKNDGKSDKQAIKVVQDEVKEITGVYPDYYALIDFDGLTEIVDAVGGVNINVDTAFTDTLHGIDYPAGKNSFDGEDAVMYTRARYATGGEGSDFQRADRQQDLIMGIKDKAFSSNTLFSPSKLSSLSKEYKENIITNLSINNLSRLRILAGDMAGENTIKAVYSTANVLTSGHSSGGAYILQPKTGDWSETQAMAKNLFKDDPTVQILNGTKEAGKAQEVTDKLAASGYNTLKPADAGANGHINTKVYDNTGRHGKVAKDLAKQHKGKIAQGVYEDAEADITIVLGNEKKKSLFGEK
ncbi:LCP family protein [Patescibacteria group bacterium]